MKKLLVILLSLTTLLISQEIFVLNGLGRTVSRIDVESGEVENNIFTTGDAPNSILYNSNCIIVVNSGTHSLTLADRNNLSNAENIILGENLNPWEGFVYNDSIILVTNWVDNSIYVINLNQKTVIKKMNTGKNPEGIIVDSGKIFVTIVNYNFSNWTYDKGYVYVYSAEDYSLLDSIEVGINPQAIAEGMDGKLHILCTGDYFQTFGQVSILDPVTLQKDTTLQLGGSPGSIAVSSNGVAYIAAGGWEYAGDTHGYIYTYDTKTYEIHHNHENPIRTHRGVMDVATDTEGNFYAACFEEDYVDVGRDSVEKSFLVGDGPQSIMVIDRKNNSIFNSSENKLITFEAPGNFPNPFNCSTTIPIRITEGSKIEINIYNLLGKRVKTLYSGYLPEGHYRFTWNGTDSRGQELPTGIYLYRIKTETGTISNRMILLK